MKSITAGKVMAAVASLGVAVSLLIAPQSAAAAKSESGTLATHNWRNEYSNSCLVVRGHANEAPAVVSACGSWADQMWAWDEGTQTLRNSNSGKCLTARTGQNPRQFTCGVWADQTWEFITYSTFYLIKNRHTGLCLAVRGTAENSPVTMVKCDKQYDDRRWH